MSIAPSNAIMITMLEKLFDEHEGIYSVIDSDSDVYDRPMRLKDIWDFYDDNDGKACEIILEILEIGCGQKHFEISNGWLVRRL